jgi:hypothetical protein
VKKLKPFNQLRHSQKAERRRRALADITNVLERHQVPASVIFGPSPLTAPPPEAILHIPHTDRKRMRTVHGLPVPSEYAITLLRQQLSTEKGTATASFPTGVYITDPLSIVQNVAPPAARLAVGGDAGGGYTKLGVTIAVGNKQTFLCLLVYKGKDTWEDLWSLDQAGLLLFNGASARYNTIYQVLQCIIDERKAFLNGDWAFINSIVGLMAPSAKHPCPICIVDNKHFLNTAPYRCENEDKSMHEGHYPLVSVPPERIVPLPLHLFLGLSNRLILEALIEIIGPAKLKELVGKVKTIHTPGKEEGLTLSI